MDPYGHIYPLDDEDMAKALDRTFDEHRKEDAERMRKCLEAEAKLTREHLERANALDSQTHGGGER